MYFLLYLCLVFCVLAPSLAYAAVLDGPSHGQTYSGVGLIYGWKCEANGPLTLRFYEGRDAEGEALGGTIPLLYGSERDDVPRYTSCENANAGFVAQWNWGILGNIYGEGTYTAVAYDSGEEFARSTFEVASFGTEFLTEASGECRVSDFPMPGESTLLAWNQATQHFEVVPESSTDEQCRAGLVVNPGESCRFGDSDLTFSARADGKGCLTRPGYTNCVGEEYNWESTRVNDLVITLIARRNSDNSWTIEEVGLEIFSGFAPADQAAFDRLVVGKRAVNVDDSQYYIEFFSAGRFVEYEPGERYSGSYRYSNTGPNTGTFTQNYDDGDVCTSQFTFTSPTTGTSRYTCDEGDQGGGGWRLE